MSDKLYFNGLNGDTGEYLFDPVSSDAIASLAAGKAIASGQPSSDWWSRILKVMRSPFQGLPMGVDPTDMAQAGWGIVYHENASAELRDALQPLVLHRRSQVPEDRCKILEYCEGQGLKEWLNANGVHPGCVAPTKVPYYLLLVGDPTEISFQFQCLLDVEYAVGRLSFDKIEHYHNYAASVIRYENESPIISTREVAYWGVKHDRATEMSADFLISPLCQGDPTSMDSLSIAKKHSFANQCLLAEDATRDNLLNLFHDRPPAMLFTASHGLGWRMGQVDHQRHCLENGALCSQDWTGESPISMENYVTGQDISDDANVHGMVAFIFACFGVGTPSHNHFLLSENGPEAIAERPFVSALAKRLLGHPRGGALAVIGHVDMAWSYSFKPPKVGQQLQPFRNLIGRILSGEPVGHSTKDFAERYAALSCELLCHLDTSQTSRQLPAKKLARTWIERNDAQNYIMLGDPGAQIRVNDLSVSKSQERETNGSPIHEREHSPTSVPQHHSMPVEQESIAAVKSISETAESATEYSAINADLDENRETQASPDAQSSFLGTVRALKAQAQFLHSSLLEAETRAQSHETRGADLSALVAVAISIRQRSIDRIAELRQTLHQLTRQHTSVSDSCGGDAVRIENHWSKLFHQWPESSQQPNIASANIEAVKTTLREIICLCGQLTVPSRVNQHLSTLRIGQALNFHQVFHDEFPDDDDRMRILSFMANHSDVVAGVVDVNAGLVHHVSQNWRRQATSIVSLLMMMVAGFGMLAVLTRSMFSPIENRPFMGRFYELSGAYVILFIGGTAHLAVASLKQARPNPQAGLVAAEDWVLWIHAREISLAISIVCFWIGTLALVFVTAKPIAWPTAFFAGYAIDNFVDLFLQRFSVTVKPTALPTVTK